MKTLTLSDDRTKQDPDCERFLCKAPKIDPELEIKPFQPQPQPPEQFKRPLNRQFIIRMPKESPKTTIEQIRMS